MVSGLAPQAVRTAGIALLTCLAFAAPSLADDVPPISLPPAPPEASQPLKVVIPNLRAAKQTSAPSRDIVLGSGAAGQPASRTAVQLSFVPGSAPSSLFEKFYSDLFPGKTLPSLPEVLRASLPPAPMVPQVATVVPAPVIKHYRNRVFAAGEPHMVRRVAMAHRVKPHVLPPITTIAAAKPTPARVAPPPAPVAAAPVAAQPLPWLVAKAEPLQEPPPGPLPEPQVVSHDMPAKKHHLSRFFANRGTATDEENKPNLAENVPTAALPKDPFDRQHRPETAVAAAPSWLSRIFAHNDTTPIEPTKNTNIIFASANGDTPQPAQVANDQKSGVIRTLHSPGAIIKREVMHMATPQPELAQAAQEMAALSPAAGENAQPLIPLPSPAASPVLPPPPVPLPPPPIPATIPPISTTAPAPPAPSLPPPISPTAKICSPGDKSCSGKDTDPLRAIIEKTGPATTPVPTEEPKISLPSMSMDKAATPAKSAVPAQPHKSSVKPSKHTASHHHHHKNAHGSAKHPHMSAAHDKPSTKKETKPKAKIPHIPAALGHKKKPEPPFTIDHAKEMNDLFKPDSDQNTIQRKGMDIAVEVKKPTMNTSYELQKAYDAVTTGNTIAAMDIYKTVLDNDPDNTNALFGLATLYHRAGDLDHARALYSKLLSIDPNNRDGWNNFLALTADESPRDAAAHLEILQSQNPDFSPIPAQLAIIYQKLGDSDKAVSNMTRAIQLAPDNLTYRYNLAIMLDKQGKYAEAAPLYRQIIEAYQRGEKVPGDIDKIQQRLTFISSNRP